MEKGKDLTFALRLRALYAASAYDRKELARTAGASISTVMRWEEGDETPNLTQFKRVAAYFGLPREFFLTPDIPETSDALPEDWKHHGTAVGNRRPELGFVMRHTVGFRFTDTEFDTP